MACPYEPSNMNMKARQRDGSCEEVSVGIAHDVANTRRHLCVISKESHFIAHLHQQDHTRVLPLHRGA